MQDVKLGFPQQLHKELIATCFFCSLSVRFVFVLQMLLVCDNIELIPWLRKSNICYNFSICHWNLNSIAAHKFEKVDLLMQLRNMLLQYLFKGIPHFGSLFQQ